MTMHVGIDWGGTKIEGVGLRPDGTELVRLREDTPRGDYEACLKAVASVIARIEGEAGESGTVGIGIPGSLDPKSGLAKGANSTWILGKPVADDLRRAIGREIRVDNDESTEATIIDVFTRDRLGVLYAITQTLADAGLDISLSKVSTEGEKVADVFYVTRDGAKITDGDDVAAIRSRLAAALEE